MGSSQSREELRKRIESRKLAREEMFKQIMSRDEEKEITKSELVAGDHIYTRRKAGYTHHGIYVDESKVIHFTAVQKKDSSSGFSISSFSTTNSTTDPDAPTSNCPENIPNCGFRKPESGVAMCCLKCFLDGGSLYRFEYGVSDKQKGIYRTIAKSDPPKEVLHRAEHLLHNGFGMYNLFKNNCEHFSVYCKTGLCLRGRKGGGMSSQITNLTSKSGSIVVRLFPRWFSSDIGDRIDVEKVPVEKLAMIKCA